MVQQAIDVDSREKFINAIKKLQVGSVIHLTLAAGDTATLKVIKKGGKKGVIIFMTKQEKKQHKQRRKDRQKSAWQSVQP